jgi:hypothetical protein
MHSERSIARRIRANDLLACSGNSPLLSSRLASLGLLPQVQGKCRIDEVWEPSVRLSLARTLRPGVIGHLFSARLLPVPAFFRHFKFRLSWLLKILFSGLTPQPRTSITKKAGLSVPASSMRPKTGRESLINCWRKPREANPRRTIPAGKCGRPTAR